MIQWGNCCHRDPVFSNSTEHSKGHRREDRGGWLCIGHKFNPPHALYFCNSFWKVDL